MCTSMYQGATITYLLQNVWSLQYITTLKKLSFTKQHVLTQLNMVPLDKYQNSQRTRYISSELIEPSPKWGIFNIPSKGFDQQKLKTKKILSPLNTTDKWIKCMH